MKNMWIVGLAHLPALTVESIAVEASTEGEAKQKALDGKQGGGLEWIVLAVWPVEMK